jgi:hypothetical protein
MRIITVTLMSMFLGSSLLLPMASDPGDAVLTQAVQKAEVALRTYLNAASQKDKETFLRYLEYYRSEGGYQAVTPAPQALRMALSEQSRVLFKTLVAYAQPLKRAQEDIPGYSILSNSGEGYFQTLLEIVREDLKKYSSK